MSTLFTKFDDENGNISAVLTDMIDAQLIAVASRASRIQVDALTGTVELRSAITGWESLLARASAANATVSVVASGMGHSDLAVIATNIGRADSVSGLRLTSAESAAEPLLRLEAVEGIRLALESLPPEQRQVVRMRIYEEKTFATIAKELKIPLGTALGRMRAATTKLRERLADRAKEVHRDGADHEQT